MRVWGSQVWKTSAKWALPEQGLAAAAGLKHPASGQEPAGPAGHPHPVVGEGHLPRHPRQQHKPTGREGPHQAPHSRQRAPRPDQSGDLRICPLAYLPTSCGSCEQVGTWDPDSPAQCLRGGQAGSPGERREGQGVLLPEDPVSQPLPCPAGKGQQHSVLKALERWGSLAQDCGIPGACS